MLVSCSCTTMILLLAFFWGKSVNPDIFNTTMALFYGSGEIHFFQRLVKNCDLDLRAEDP